MEISDRLNYWTQFFTTSCIYTLCLIALYSLLLKSLPLDFDSDMCFALGCRMLAAAMQKLAWKVFMLGFALVPLPSLWEEWVLKSPMGPRRMKDMRERPRFADLQCEAKPTQVGLFSQICENKELLFQSLCFEVVCYAPLLWQKLIYTRCKSCHGKVKYWHLCAK